MAVTRARKFVCVIGDSETVKSDGFLGKMVEYFQQNGEQRTAEAYRAHEEINVRFGTGWFGEYS